MISIAAAETPLEDFKFHLKKMIIEELSLIDVTPEEINDDEPLFGGQFGLDSIDAVELVFQIKKHYGVAIRDMKEGRTVLQTINSLTEFIQKHQKT